jgi:hypothetical protein
MLQDESFGAKDRIINIRFSWGAARKNLGALYGKKENCVLKIKVLIFNQVLLFTF